MSFDAPNLPEARGFCAQCGKSLTAETLRTVRGVYYCEDCLAERVAMPLPTKQEGGGGPALAAVLGFIPGLGAIFNGEYLKALIHVLVFGSIIALMVRTQEFALFVPLLIIFILYMPFEAYRTAKAKAQGKPAPSFFGEHQTKVPVGPVLLIVLGGLLLLDRFDVLNLDRVAGYLWPLALIALGVHLLRRRMQAASSPEEQKQ